MEVGLCLTSHLLHSSSLSPCHTATRKIHGAPLGPGPALLAASPLWAASCSPTSSCLQAQSAMPIHQHGQHSTRAGVFENWVAAVPRVITCTTCRTSLCSQSPKLLSTILHSTTLSGLLPFQGVSCSALLF